MGEQDQKWRAENRNFKETSLFCSSFDEILEKLSDEGWENLTESEQKILYNASEKYSKTDHPN